jgi:hypothetical protein
MTKKNIGQLLSLKFKFSNETINCSGYLIDYNDEWVLIKDNPTDYVIDGYILLRSKYATEFKRGNAERFKQKILDLKGQKPKRKEIIPIENIETILAYLSSKFGCFLFYQRTNRACWLGKVNKIKGTDLKIDYLNPRAIWSNTMPVYKLGNIRVIEFDTDYINSLLLIANKRK